MAQPLNVSNSELKRLTVNPENEASFTYGHRRNPVESFWDPSSSIQIHEERVSVIFPYDSQVEHIFAGAETAGRHRQRGQCRTSPGEAEDSPLCPWHHCRMSFRPPGADPVAFSQLGATVGEDDTWKACPARRGHRQCAPSRDNAGDVRMS